MSNHIPHADLFKNQQIAYRACDKYCYGDETKRLVNKIYAFMSDAGVFKHYLLLLTILTQSQYLYCIPIELNCSNYNFVDSSKRAMQQLKNMQV